MKLRALVFCLSLASVAYASPKELGLNIHQSPDVGPTVTKDAGLGWVRIDLNWLQAEPNVQGTYDWTIFDTQINAATAKGLNVLAVIAYGPTWASQGDTKGDGPNNDVPKAGTYASFVTAAVNRYKAKVTHYELWNEPNLAQFWEGSTQDYIDRVLVPGADALHTECPTCKVVGPALATVGTAYASWMDAVLTQAEPKVDILSGHIYASFPDGSGGGAGFTSDSFFNKLDAHRKIMLGSVVVYEGPLSFKEVMDAHSVTKPFWITETGIEATRGDATAEEKQRVFYRQVMEQMLVRPWWTTTIFYEGFDEPPAMYHFGVCVHQGGSAYDPKPVFALLQKVTSSQPAFGGTKTDCDDGLDNDFDGLVDFPADTTCASLASPSEGTPVPTDGGMGSSSSSSSSSSSGASGAAGDDAGAGAAPPGDGGGGGGGGGCATTPGSGAPIAALVGLALVVVRRRRRR